MDALIRLNVTALTRLSAAMRRQARAAAGEGAIVNVSSWGPRSELGMTVYGATKAFVTYLSQGLQLELGPKGVYVQAVLPGATRTEIWERSGLRERHRRRDGRGRIQEQRLAVVRSARAVHHPAVAGRGSVVGLVMARLAMLPNFRQDHAAERYQVRDAAA